MPVKSLLRVKLCFLGRAGILSIVCDLHQCFLSAFEWKAVDYEVGPSAP